MKAGTFAAQVNRHVQASNGVELAALFDVFHTPVLGDVNRTTVESQCRGKAKGGWLAMCVAHVQCVGHLRAGDVVEACNSQREVVDKFIALLSEESTNWSTPVLHVLCRRVGNLAMQQAKASSQSEGRERIERVAESLRRGMGATAYHKAPDAVSKKRAALVVINTTLKLYFKVHALRLAKFQLGVVNTPAFPALESFPIAQQVTYRFFAGRVAMLEGQLTQADEDLSFALQHCHAAAPSNAAAIARVLVPVKVLRGRMPSAAFLSRHGLEGVYGGLLQCVRRGDLKGYRAAVRQHRKWYIDTGVYMMVEAMELLVARSICREVYVQCNVARITCVHPILPMPLRQRACPRTPHIVNTS
jgi:hypothetical protein